MTFGEAIKQMHNGKLVSRNGWNGKDMFLFISTAIDITPVPPRASNKKILPSICMKTANDDVVIGWLASQTDMLAIDWNVV
jgi:hypothetical protein